ncbi:hypothetical protein Rsub_00049 [Raphidocelis subcapitata]|uniref:RRM domain-containing protein n=1 Tax=Raphidocelis subcapitata TaxID=307507 RepID=A0A2V0NJF1_9CHLO|nr:hypothetical protein Rsub_00049 [Raphidocelis subcapitata]|eukprot:GBF87338.1 hypothetical protein Rsub_00049 [Raphidocelis subcapitata]
MRERSRSRSPPKAGVKRSRSRSASPNARARRGWSDPDPSATAAAAAQAVAAALAQHPTALVPGLAGLPAIPFPTGDELAAAAGGAALPPPIISLPASMFSNSLVTAGSGSVRTAAQEAAARKAREIYIGNLAIGQTTADVLRELFNAALVGFVDNPSRQQAVSEIKMDPAGRFAFVEFTSEELASQALTLDRTEVYGKGMKIARPQGYLGPQDAKASAAGPMSDKVALAQQLAAKLAGAATNVVLLEGLVDVATLCDEEERREITEMVYEEALRCGRVRGVALPLPGPDVPDATPCRVYVKFDNSGDGAKCKQMMNGRIFDDRKITADYVTEVEYSRAATGEWFTGNILDAGPPPLPGALPGAPPLPAVGGSLTGLPTIKL